LAAECNFDYSRIEQDTPSRKVFAVFEIRFKTDERKPAHYSWSSTRKTVRST
jgi:hypothetical protein